MWRTFMAVLLCVAYAGCSTANDCSAAGGCSGCCLEGICLTESKRTESACGRGGEACFACERGLSCNPEGECVALGAWRLVPVRAAIDPAWQEPDGGAPDPFVELGCDNVGRVVTPVVSDSYTPLFAATDVPCLRDASSMSFAGFSFTLRDDDGADGTPIATMQGIRVTKEDFVRGSKTVSNGTTVQSVEFSLIRD